MAGTRARATPTRDATPTRSSLRQREKKKAKSVEVLGTVAEEVAPIDVEDIDIPAPPVPVRVCEPIGTIGTAIDSAATNAATTSDTIVTTTTDSTNNDIGNTTVATGNT